MKHEEWMQEAVALSIKGVTSGEGGPFGAIVVKDGVIVGRGNNKVTTTNDPTAHAEVVAIRDACKNLGTFQLTGCVVYTSCEPCPMCLSAIYWARLDRIYYAQTRQDAALIGFDDAFLYHEVVLPPEQRAIKMHHIANETAARAMQEWQDKTDKICY